MEISGIDLTGPFDARIQALCDIIKQLRSGKRKPGTRIAALEAKLKDAEGFLKLTNKLLAVAKDQLAAERVVRRALAEAAFLANLQKGLLRKHYRVAEEDLDYSTTKLEEALAALRALDESDKAEAKADGEEE